MGSGNKFRIERHNLRYFNLGIYVAYKSEHTVSIGIGLAFITIYIGIGKGYDE